MRHSFAILTLLGLAACTHAARQPSPPIPDPYAVLPDARVERASKISLDSLMETLSVRQRVGQLVMPWLLGNYAAFRSDEFDTLGVWIDSLDVGGILISVGSPLDIASKLNALQRRAHLPLLVAADLEWGSGMRLLGGTTFPMAMAIGATGHEADAYAMGRITALEARAVGIHLTFSPVADVNNNPNNPIINTRSFGEDPREDARLVAAYIHGVQDHGLFTTAKHFPGHGDTEADSHIDLPVVHACWDRLDSLELLPFRAAIEAGVTAVMTAHLAVPCLDGDSSLPATLAPAIMSGVLRDSLGFRGLVVTDALSMGAIVQRYGAGESAVLAFLAGSDLVLAPGDVRAAVNAMVAAVDSGRISRQRLDRSVRLVLRLKREAGLFGRRTVPLDSVPRTVGRTEFENVADDIAARAITLVRRGPIDTFRLRAGRTALISYAEETNLSVGNRVARELRLAGDTVTMFRLYPASGPASYDSARAVLAGAPRVAFAVSVRFLTGRGFISLPDSLAALIRATAEAKSTALLSLGSPYLLNQLPDFSGAYLVGWSDVPAAERAAAQALTGAAVTGHLPITLGTDLPRGVGIELPAHPRESPAGATLERLNRLRDWLQAEADSGAFPGGVLLVGSHGRVVYQRPFGHYGVDDPRPVADTTVYDMASLTKVIGLTTETMLLAAEGSLGIEAPVQRYVPAFQGPGKEAVTVRHLLTHTSGLPAWVPLYLTTTNRAEALRQVDTTSLEAPPGERYVYSDLGAMTLMQVVEAVTGEPLDRFLARRVFGPLGMTRTRYVPPEAWRPFIAPTENDPWRGHVLLGEVHDENAARLGGVSGHAGLFSNASDLARFAFWLLDAWHGRLAPNAEVTLPAQLVRQFTSRQPGPSGSTRALGWDTPSANGSGSSGSMLSPQSFGHTGFTGTSIWIDPVREMVIVLLTNRVHPTRENRAILKIRPIVADSVVAALLDQPGGGS